MDVIGRYGTIGYIFPSTPKDYTHEIRDEVHNLIFKVERKVLAFKPAEYEVISEIIIISSGIKLANF